MIDWPTAQRRLGVLPDNRPGPVTYGALLTNVAARTVDPALGAALAAHASAYAIDANPNRLAAFVGETAHESGGFQYLREVWGPTAAQKTYDGRMGNTAPGDGYRYRGRGLIQLTGKDNYADFGARLGIDLVNHPELAEQPDGAVRTALAFWQARDLNAKADRQDWAGITRTINGGTNGAAQRLALITKARSILS